MLNRTAVATQRPPAQRSASGELQNFPHLLNRPDLPSRLSNVRSASSGSHFLDPTDDDARVDSRNSAAFASNQRKAAAPRQLTGLEDEDDEPPAKRAKTGGSSLRASPEHTYDSGNEEKDVADSVRAHDGTHTVRPGSPLAPPPRSYVLGSQTTAQKCNGSVADMAARRADGAHPPAMATPLPPPKSVADFSPWSGHHPEDVMNEQVVKAGYFDKGPGPCQSESNSARHTIWPNLSQKNNIGLQTLSHLFTQVMEKRQALGKCTAPSSFKPPPRVTVTDTKREAWLRDLANPDVPLRKQSRTIPHGIRGKLLMEQCLSKEIPLQRAVWLAKCVGANELRAFRRKAAPGAAAASGESKWIREWTVHVEQFVEGIVATAGQENWRAKMSYAIKLSCAMYAEQILDTDHYLDWIVSSFVSATVEGLSVWINIVQIYWRDIVAFTRRGRRLAEGILERLSNTTSNGGPANDALKARLHKLVAVLFVTNRGCLVIPKTWEKYKHLLTPRSPTNAGPETTATNILKRNERLTAPLRMTSPESGSPLVQVYKLLDWVALSVDIDMLATKTSSLIEEPAELVGALLDWASTRYRRGRFRVYLTAGIIARLSSRGADTDAAILSYLSTTGSKASLETDNIYMVVAELIRCERFSVRRYLQWLIASGALSAGASACAAGLLAAIPVAAVPSHLQNLRQTLLDRMRQRSGDPAMVHSAVMGFEAALADADAGTAVFLHFPGPLSTSAKWEVGSWIKSHVTVLVKNSELSHRMFNMLRSILEDLEDMHALAYLLEAASTSDDFYVLAATTSTLNMHAETFAAFGCLDTLLDELVERYRTLRTQQLLLRKLVLALTGLVERLPKRASTLQLLNDDLIFCEQQQQVTGCSPASDNLIGMHASTLDSDDDIDAVFASGNSMDEQLMRRVFARLALRAEKASALGVETSGRLSEWLDQLRSLDAVGLDKLLGEYVQRNIDGRPETISAISTFIASGCLGMDAVVRTAETANTSAAAAAALKLLTTPSVVNGGLYLSEQYSFRLQQQRFCTDHAGEVSGLLSRAAEDAAFEAEDSHVIDLVLGYAATHPSLVLSAFENAPQSRTLQKNGDRLIRALLKRGFHSAASDLELDLHSLVRLVDPLSINFCVARMSLYHARERTGLEPSDGRLKQALIDIIMAQSPVWRQLLRAADRDTLRAMHVWARDQLLSSIGHERDDDAEETLEQRYLEVADTTYNAIQDEDDSNIIGLFADRLKASEKELSDPRSRDSALSVPTRTVLGALRVLLQLCALHLAQRAESETAKHARGNLVAVLCGLLIHPALQMQQDMLQYLQDVASGYVDTLPQEGVGLLAQQFSSEHGFEARLRSLLGTTEAPDGWLALSSKTQAQGSQQQWILTQVGGPSTAPGAGRIGQPSQSTQKADIVQRQETRVAVERKITAFPLRRWEVISDPTPIMGENDTSLSLGLFGARKVL